MLGPSSKKSLSVFEFWPVWLPVHQFSCFCASLCIPYEGLVLKDQVSVHAAKSRYPCKPSSWCPARPTCNCGQPLNQLSFEHLLLAGVVPFLLNTQEQSPDEGLIKEASGLGLNLPDAGHPKALCLLSHLAVW